MLEFQRGRWERFEAEEKGFAMGSCAPPPTPPCLFYLPKNLTIPSPTLIDNKRPMVSTKLPVGYWCCLENVAVKCEMGAVSFLLFNAHSRLCFQNARRIWIHPVTCDVHLFVHSARRQMHIYIVVKFILRLRSISITGIIQYSVARTLLGASVKEMTCRATENIWDFFWDMNSNSTFVCAFFMCCRAYLCNRPLP